jgi:ABC-type transport system substrate-binding protein
MLGRTRLGSQTRRVTFLAALMLAAGLFTLAAAEEEEANPRPPVKKIEVPDAEPPPSTPAPANVPAGVYFARLDDVARAATAATNPTIKKYLAGFTVAYDRLDDAKFKSHRITPVPFLWGKDKFPAEFGVAPLNTANGVEEVKTYKPRGVRHIDPFEQLAIDATVAFLKPTPPGPGVPTPSEKLSAAERLLTAVMFFHDSAREQNRRRGKNWEPIKTALYDKLTEVRIARVQQVAADKDWAKLKELSTRLIGLYRSKPKVLEPVYAARLAEAEQLVRSERVAELEKGRTLLNEYESRFPNTGNETAKRVRQILGERAKKFLNEADRIIGSNKTEARTLLKNVEAIDPDNPALRQLQNQLKSGYPVLVVGARRLPERMSPTLARFDSERQAVQLMFEGLLEALPDELTGVRFRPALADGRPIVGAGSRDTQLVRSANWTGPDGGIFDAADVAGTLRLFRQKPGSWAAAPAAWLNEPGFDPADPGHIRMRFKLGHPDPRQLLTFKMHPAQWLLQKNKTIDDVEFARHPFGTGPYKLAPGYRPPAPGESSREVIFVSNPGYARRPGRMGQPVIKEIRFIDIKPIKDLPTEFRADRLHILTDVPTADLPKYRVNNNLGGKVRVVTATRNRREYILAINHRRPQLQNPDVRQGLLHAIDRERILNDVFRAGVADAHSALAGPFPVGCWATPHPLGAAPPSLYNRDVAQAKFRQYLATPAAASSLDLAYPDDEPQAKAACERIKGMVESATAGAPKLTINLKPLPPRELIRLVEEEQRYDLAYVPFDYPDDWYPLALGSFLDPNAAGAGGRNYLGYRAKDSAPGDADDRLGRLLDEARLHRDPAKLVELSHEIHRRFIDAVPFVPLWQIDRHMVISTAVKVYLDGQAEEANPRLLDATTLFSSIGRWRIE